jgi:hypothetical protein
MWHAWEEKKRHSYGILVGKPKEKRLLGTWKTYTKWASNIAMQLKETGWDGTQWIHVVQNREKCWVLVNMSINF